MNKDEKKTTEDEGLWLGEDVMAFAKCGRVHLSMLCTTGKIPYIPGNPYRYVPAEVRKAVFAMQVGGLYGRRKTKTKSKAAKKIAA